MPSEKAQRFGKWITRKFLDLQSEAGRAWTVTEFAEYLDCRQQNVSRWMLGRVVPDPPTIDKLARKLGDDIYDIVGLPRPDPDLRYIAANWERASARLRRAVRGLLEKGLDKDD